MLYMSLRLFDDYDLIRCFQLDIMKLLRLIGMYRVFLIFLYFTPAHCNSRVSTQYVQLPIVQVIAGILRVLLLKTLKRKKTFSIHLSQSDSGSNAN